MSIDVSEIVALLASCISLTLAIVRLIRKVRGDSDEHAGRGR